MQAVAEHPKERSFLEHYVRGLGTSTRNNAVAYGYSVTVALAFAMIDHFRPHPSVVDILLFAVGAGAAFALVNVSVTRGFRKTVAQEPRLVVALGTSFSVLSICAGAGVAALVAWQVAGHVPWLVGSFAATIAYLLAAALEVALARTAHLVAGTDAGSEAED